MKLNARIKRKQVRRVSAKPGVIFIDPIGDAALLSSLMAAARKAGRQDGFYRINA